MEFVEIDILIYILFSFIVKVFIRIMPSLESSFLKEYVKTWGQWQMRIRRWWQFLYHTECNLKGSGWMVPGHLFNALSPGITGKLPWKVVGGFWEHQCAWYIFRGYMNNLKEEISSVKNGFRLCHHHSNTSELLLNGFYTYHGGKKLCSLLINNFSVMCCYLNKTIRSWLYGTGGRNKLISFQ